MFTNIRVCRPMRCRIATQIFLSQTVVKMLGCIFLFDNFINNTRVGLYSLYTAIMYLARVYFGVLLNLFSVQLTFGGTGDTEKIMYVPSTQPFDMRSMVAQPFIQAQFHPASGTIQQGIMIPQEHIMPQVRMGSEEQLERMLYSEALLPHDRMVPQEWLVSQERLMPQLSMDEQRLIPHQRVAFQDSTTTSEDMAPQGTMMNEQRKVPQHDISASLTNQFQSNPPTQMSGQRMVPRQQILSQPSMASQHGTVPHEGRMVPQDVMESQENVQKILHTSPASHSLSKDLEGATIPNELTEAHNGLKRAEEDLIRAVKGGYDYSSHSQAPYSQTPSYGYNSPPSYSAPATAPPSYSPPAVHSDLDTKFLKPDLTDLIKPVTGKMAGKLNGLVGLVLSLLGSGKGLEVTGIKELLIDGILKPILVAKGGLKALISKLAVPIVSLILINVEVLITVWWLWEDCPAQVQHEVEYAKPSYPAPASPSYNY